jgi:hypothetical protein
MEDEIHKTFPFETLKEDLGVDGSTKNKISEVYTQVPKLLFTPILMGVISSSSYGE